VGAVAKLKAVVGLDPKAYKAGAKQVGASNKKMKDGFKGIAASLGLAFSVGAVIAAGKALMDYATNVSIAARNVGILTSEMIALNKVALQNNLGVGEMTRLLSKLQSELFRAAEGEEMSREKFERLGLSIKDLAALDPASMLREVAIAAMESELPLQTLTELFGERLGPGAVTALKAIAENGLPAVDESLGVTADNVEALSSKWGLMLDDAKTGVLGLVGELDKIGSAIQMFLVGAFDSKQEGTFTEKGMRSVQLEKDRLFKDQQKRIQDRKDAAKKAAAEIIKIAEETEKRLSDIEKKKEQKKIDAVTKKTLALQKTFEDKVDALTKKSAVAGQSRSVASGSIRADAVVQSGGVFKDNRAGIGVQSKAIQVAQEQKAILEQIRDLQKDNAAAIRRANGEIG